MNPADQRITELVDKWVASLELHLRYVSLTDEAYWQVQPWPRHQRPARWILDLAHVRARELKRQVAERVAAQDTGFAEALELMAFLANLVGVQNIERFIPLAEPERENREVLGQTQSTLSPLTSTSTQTRTILEPTREMRPPPLPPEPVAAPEPPPPPPPRMPAPPPRAAPPPPPRFEPPPPPRAAPPPPRFEPSPPPRAAPPPPPRFEPSPPPRVEPPPPPRFEPPPPRVEAPQPPRVAMRPPPAPAPIAAPPPPP
ncbi:MAG TPA: hypothetical protein VMT92_09600, partial [Steroidobacteraceae bacterium]|nr:hypothetical protein [Steroidobacteraceae bacterium]